MTDPGYSVLLVDGDANVRARVTDQLSPLGCKVYEAEDGNSALRLLRENNDIRVVLSELYLKTGEQDCLVRAVRGFRALANTRTLAHTRHNTAPDRAWAMQSGADAYLIQPTRPSRLRYVVARLALQTPVGSAPATRSTVARRDSLDAALQDIEGGAAKDTSSIVFGRDWWASLTPRQQAAYRSRANKARVSLRSDSLLSDHFVELRRRAHTNRAPSRTRPESPYRG